MKALTSNRHTPVVLACVLCLAAGGVAAMAGSAESSLLVTHDPGAFATLNRAKGSSVQDALAAGYKLGFTGGTDNHCGRPALCFAWQEMNRGRLPLHCQSLTGVWTDRIERRSVWKALYDRHTWAAWDTRALVHFEVNGAAAGDDVTVQQGKPLQARVKISAEDSLQSLEVVSEKAVCWSGSVDALDCDLKIDLAPATRTTHFFLRGLLRNGGILYASPVFFTVRK